MVEFYNGDCLERRKQMKVYIDLDNLEDITNNALIKISRKNAKPEIVRLVGLCSLADHDKQVRKEVVQEIRQKATIKYYEEYNGFDRKIGKTYIIRDYDLDQIQGETK